MHKPLGSLTAMLAVGIALLVACASSAPTPATQTPIPRATKTLQSGTPPRFNPANPSVPANFDNPERFGGYNTNLKWLFKTGGQIRTMPRVSEGTVYIGSDGGLGTPGLYAISIETGEQRWNFPVAGGVQSTVASQDGAVYFGGRDKNLYALDRRTGAEIWRFETGDWVDTDPVIVGSTIIFGSRDDNVYAVDIETGTERWRFFTGGEAVSSPAVAGGLVYIGSNDGNMYALDVETGQEAWRFTTGLRVESSPLVVDGLVYFGSFDNFLYALDASSGKVEWQFNAQARVVSSPAAFEDLVIFGSGDAQLYALDRETGRTVWTFRTLGEIFSSPSVEDGVVYFGSNDGNLYAVNARTGSELWRFKTPDQVVSTPAVHQGVVYFGDVERTLYALEVSAKAKEPDEERSSAAMFGSGPSRSGFYDTVGLDRLSGVKWDFETIGEKKTIRVQDLSPRFQSPSNRTASSGGVRSSPALSDGVLFFGSEDGHFYSVDAATGREIWS